MSTEEASVFVVKCESKDKAVSVTTNFAFKTKIAFLAEIPHLAVGIHVLQNKQLVSNKRIVAGKIFMYVLLTKAFPDQVRVLITMLYIPSQDMHYCLFPLCEIIVLLKLIE